MPFFDNDGDVLDDGPVGEVVEMEPRTLDEVWETPVSRAEFDRLEGKLDRLLTMLESPRLPLDTPDISQHVDGWEDRQKQHLDALHEYGRAAATLAVDLAGPGKLTSDEDRARASAIKMQAEREARELAAKDLAEGEGFIENTAAWPVPELGQGQRPFRE